MEPWPLINELPVLWERAVWDQGDARGAPIVFYMEFNDDGVLLRQVELAEDDQPIAAASLAEFWAAQGGLGQATTPQLDAYEARFGGTADGCRQDWDEYPGQSITREEFEWVWHRSRSYLANSER